MEERLRRGLRYLVTSEAMAELALSPAAFNAAVSRLAKKSRVARLRKGFVLILRSENSWAGGPEAARWIDPFMRHLGIDYRISLLSAAAFRGSSHQAPHDRERDQRHVLAILAARSASVAHSYKCRAGSSHPLPTWAMLVDV